VNEVEFEKRLTELIVECSSTGLLSFNTLIPRLHALYKEAGYVRLSQDQSLPELNWDSGAIRNPELYLKATQQDMLNKGWRKVASGNIPEAKGGNEMSNWRPDGWENNKKIVLYGGGRQTGRAEYAISKAFFEAGADAMLEALKKQGIDHSVYADHLRFGIDRGVQVLNGKEDTIAYQGARGTLAFIPD